MFSGPEHLAMLVAAREWNNKYAIKTGIRVKATALNRIGYFEKLETQLMGGLSSPDIVQPFSLHLEKLKKYFEPLNSYLKETEMMQSPSGEKYSLDNMLPAAMKTVEQKDGTIYMLPKDMSQIILYYRKDLILKNLYNICKKYTNTDYVLLNELKFKNENNILYNENITISNFNKILPLYNVVNFKFTKNSKIIFIKKFNYYTLNNENINALLEQLNYNVN
jgi:ABC-type glycerol-3-phosphate transport system substrate-binding protein